MPRATETLSSSVIWRILSNRQFIVSLLQKCSLATQLISKCTKMPAINHIFAYFKQTETTYLDTLFSQISFIRGMSGCKLLQWQVEVIRHGKTTINKWIIYSCEFLKNPLSISCSHQILQQETECSVPAFVYCILLEIKFAFIFK